MKRHSEKRLAAWLKKRLQVKGLVATSPAPVWENDTPDPDQQRQLEALDSRLSDKELSFEPALRYAHAPVPETLRLLRQHEGAAAGALAVLCPEDEAHLDKLNRLSREHGFRLVETASGETDLSLLPACFANMRKAEVISAADGTVRLQAGTTWQTLKEAAETYRLAVPDVLHDRFPMPADAARQGFLPCLESRTIGGITTSFDISLPPTGTRWLDRLWLFCKGDIAFEKFRQICRQNPPAYAEFISAPTLQLGQQSGFYSLPRKYFQKQDYYGIRLVFQAPLMAGHSAAFAASWPLERNWGVQQNGLRMPPQRDQTDLLLAQGAAVVSVSTQTAWKDIIKDRQYVEESLRVASLQHSPAASFTPMTWSNLAFTGGKLNLHSTVCMPRDYMAPLEQWQRVYEAATSLSPEPEARPLHVHHQISEESPEWRAIRDALIDENGQLRPLPAQADEQDEPALRHHG